MELFGRKWAVTVGTTLVTALDVAFRIERSLKPEPNTCDLTIWNLNTQQRAILESLKPPKGSPIGIPTKIEAGYETAASTIWLGDLRSVESMRDGADWVTILGSGDGEVAVQTARVNQSFGMGTPVTAMLNILAASMKLGPGNLAMFAAAASASQLGQQGIVMSGSAADQLTEWTRSLGWEWSIQNSSLQFTQRGKPAPGLAVMLSSKTGLIGQPTVDQDGLLYATCLMIPGIMPGTLAVIASERVQGNYRIEQTVHYGDTAGEPWFVDIVAARI